MTTCPQETIALQLDNISLAFQPNNVLVIDRVSMTVNQGEFVTIIGPSGCGKTTILRIMAGLLRPTKGAVYLDGQILDGPAHGTVLVMQDYSRSLLPWRRAISNVELGLETRGLCKEERRAIAQSWLERVGMPDQGERYPYEMSGGMQQRLAVARALASQPSVLLMDEPFGSLDAYTRESLEDDLLSLHHDLKLTIVMVTHDIDEALYLGERAVLLTERPTSTRDELVIPFGSNRNQTSTRLNPEFLQMRKTLRQHLGLR